MDEDRLFPEDVEEFRRIVKEETGHELSTQEAWNRAIELIAMVRMMVKPYPEDDEGPRKETPPTP